MIFVPAVAYHFCLTLPAAFTQPRDQLLAESSVPVLPLLLVEALDPPPDLLLPPLGLGGLHGDHPHLVVAPPPHELVLLLLPATLRLKKRVVVTQPRGI